MKKLVLSLSLCLLATAWLLPLNAAAPVNVDDVAPIEDLVAESDSKIEALIGYVKDEASFGDAMKDKNIAQDGGVLACLAQAIAEHSKHESTKVAGPDMREAALAFRNSKSLDEAKKALEKVKEARAGESSKTAEVEYPWNKLINLHRMMEEVNARNATLRRLIRRPKDPQADSLHATTLAVLAVAMIADTHEVKDEADLPKWNGFATDYQKTMTELAAALKKKDSDTSKELYVKGGKTCSACHEVFRKE